MEAIIEQMCASLIGKVLKGEVHCEILADESSGNSASGTTNRMIGIVLNADLVIRIRKYKINNRFGDYPGDQPSAGKASYYASLANKDGRVFLSLGVSYSPSSVETLYNIAEGALCCDGSVMKNVFVAVATAYKICCS